MAALHHLEILEKNEKLSIISSALKNSLTLASNIGAVSICCGILIGGWRLEIEEALDEMIKTYQWFKLSFSKAPQLNIYILGNEEFSRVEEYLNLNYPDIKRLEGGCILL